MLKHGMSSSSEYNSWHGMKSRCFNPTDPAFKHYGGRGIIVCKGGKNDFSIFYKDMGPKPGKEYSIDRVDVNGNYEPSNCRWADRSTQQKNKRKVGDFYKTFNEPAHFNSVLSFGG